MNESIFLKFATYYMPNFVVNWSKISQKYSMSRGFELLLKSYTINKIRRFNLNSYLGCHLRFKTRLLPYRFSCVNVRTTMIYRTNLFFCMISLKLSLRLKMFIFNYLFQLVSSVFSWFIFNWRSDPTLL